MARFADGPDDLRNLIFVAKRHFSYQNVLFVSHKYLMFNQLIVFSKRRQILTDVNGSFDEKG